MPDSINHHADMLRQCVVMGGYVEIQQPGCESPETVFSGQLLIMQPPDHSARNAIRQARQRALTAAAVEDGNMATAGRYAAEEVTLIIAAWARTLDNIERGGGCVTYRARS
ncbi:hypothetical protein H0A73_17255 [Alcaligenaceae bacterium]|nr:hypothetical protein [Alcaligenaceae bacterium]